MVTIESFREHGPSYAGPWRHACRTRILRRAAGAFPTLSDKCRRNPSPRNLVPLFLPKDFLLRRVHRRWAHNYTQRLLKPVSTSTSVSQSCSNTRDVFWLISVHSAHAKVPQHVRLFELLSAARKSSAKHHQLLARQAYLSVHTWDVTLGIMYDSNLMSHREQIVRSYVEPWNRGTLGTWL